ncbi:MAG: hypothetical protein Q8S58_08430 [Bosea sp. (in: a-proteobacteria)]|uniref:hypothetical protein n=1 Tax=Bosea sp. (in: a-proteobacteria) TaxID=1871050 RepID=UPI0027368432|nr:hypothetical protein [Bosea sp. (in: a-proteobacteria)]MDP3258703.1 hypothetical protein [Bosea sp. (in: a-proteobacteria)]MDP3319144.1 hypothetical protein [Bosea sp. (in: a-proteobacteria)]
MTIETSEDYDAALARLAALGDDPAEGPQQDEFLAISAAMVAYETRNHPALSQGGQDDP